jgi:alanyl-tRNA synthetase
MTGVNDIRAAFLGYFAREGHEVVPSSPLVPRNDPTLMFTNAGMVQFKNVFTGLEKRPYSRAVTARKAVLVARGDGAEMRPRRRQAQRSR